MAEGIPPSTAEGANASATDTVAAHLPPETRAELLRRMMERQAALGINVAAIFLALIFGLPLLNWLAPKEMNAVGPGGFTWSWLFLAVLFYPITMLLSAYFVRTSDRIETELVKEGRALIHGEEGAKQ